MAVFNIEGYNSYSGCDITVSASLPMINGQSVGKHYVLGSIQTLSISTHQDKRPVRSLGVINAKDYVMGPRTIAGSMVFAVFNKHFATEIMEDLGATETEVILPDEIPALDITVNFANEYGRMSRMAIYGVKLINEGQVMSINDLYTENTYQFVALGLEPLSAEVDGNSQYSSSKKTNPKYKNNMPGYSNASTPYLDKKYNNNTSDLIISNNTNKIDALLADDIFNDNSGSNIANQIKNNQDLTNEILLNDINKHLDNGNIILTVSTEDARNDNLGIAIFNLNPIQTEGTIFIYSSAIESYSIQVTEIKTSYSLSLPKGNYTAQFMNTNSKSSNIVEFNIDNITENQLQILSQNYPTIEKITNNSITVLSNTNNHDKINCYRTGGTLITVDSNRKAVTISGLEENTEYNIYTSNSNNNSRSDIVTVKTFTYDNEESMIFKDFVNSNSNLLVSDKETLDLLLDQINFNKYTTMIDAVLSLPESLEKQELLIYATHITNQLIDSYNISNNNHIMSDIQDGPFDSTITVSGYNKVNCYLSNNNKMTLVNSFNGSEENFYAAPNKHYTLYGYDNDIRTVKKDFAVCRNNVFDKLNKYTDVNNYQRIDLDYYKNQYQLYDNDVIQSIAIKDNYVSDMNILTCPYIYVLDNKIYADVFYPTLNTNDEYYLVFTEIKKSLDTLPKRKIKFDTNTRLINLNSYYPGLVKEKQYLFWIENSNLRKISKPFLFVYSNNTEQFDAILKKELNSKMLNIKNNMIIDYDNKPMLTELFASVLEQKPEEKNQDDVLINNMISTFTDSLYVESVLEALYILLCKLHKPSNIKIKPEISINKKQKYIDLIDIQGFYPCAIHYTGDEVNRLPILDNQVFYDNEGYIYLFYVSDTMLYKTNFILIECNTGEYKCDYDLLENITEVK